MRKNVFNFSHILISKHFFIFIEADTDDDILAKSYFHE